MTALSPPFPCWPLDRPDKLLAPILLAARRRFPIIDSRACETVAAFQSYCCPREPSVLGIEVTTELLLWLLVLNDTDDMMQRAIRLQSFREGLMFGEGASELHRGGKHFASRLAPLPGRDFIIERIRAVFEDFLLEALMLDGARDVLSDVNHQINCEPFCLQRPHLVGNAAYIALWQQCQKWETSNPDLVKRAEDITISAIAESNDIATSSNSKIVGTSVSIRVPKPDGNTLNDLIRLCAQHQRRLDELTVAGDTASSDCEYIQYLKGIIGGNVRAMQSLVPRYDAPELISVFS